MYFVIFYKAIRKFLSICKNPIYTPIAKCTFLLNGVTYGKQLKVYGIMNVHVTRRGIVFLGKGVKINSGHYYNLIGRQQKAIVWVDGTLHIGNNVGMSSTAIICNHKITIGNNVTIGGNTVIYDTDFHNIDPAIRLNKSQDKITAIKLPVVIHDNVFIGAHSTILKGVTIGENSVIGACSLISKNIPANEIWAGNPAKFIKKIND